MKMKEWKKIIHSNGNQKRARVAVLKSDKWDFKSKTVSRDKMFRDTITKGSIRQKTTIVNIYAPNIGAPKYINQILIDPKEEIDNNIIIIGDFNTALSIMDRSDRKSVKNKIKHCTWTIL